MGSGASSSAHADDAHDLIDKIIVFGDRNSELTRVGSATYRVTTRHGSETYALSLAADGRMRVDVGSRRMVKLHDSLVDFNADILDRIAQGNDPLDYTVNIRRPEALDVPVHLQHQGLPPVRFRASLVANMMRRVRREDPDLKAVQIEHLPDRVRISIKRPDVEHWQQVDIAPDFGYLAIGSRVFVRSDPDLPLEDVATHFRRVAPGAFVADHIKIQTRKRGEPTLTLSVEVKLMNVSLRPPSDEVFTIEGLGVPRGVKIYDGLAMKEYVHGYRAVTEHDVVAPETFGADTHRWPGRMFAVVVLAAFLGVIVYVCLRAANRKH